MTTRFKTLLDYIRESNMIEGIHREPSEAEVMAHHDFLFPPRPVTIPMLVEFVGRIQPDAMLRDRAEVPGVRVGCHVAPSSGPDIRFRLSDVLFIEDPWEQHCAYLTLHPFTDGNGRSARALWLQRANGHAPIGFLHRFYYETLSRADGRAPKPVPAAVAGFGEEHSAIYNENYGGRSVKRSHRAEGRNYVD